MDGDLLPILPCPTHTALLFCFAAQSRLVLNSVASCLSLLWAEMASVHGQAWLVLPSGEIVCCQLRGMSIILSTQRLAFGGRMAIEGRMGVPAVRVKSFRQVCGGWS